MFPGEDGPFFANDAQKSAHDVQDTYKSFSAAVAETAVHTDGAAAGAQQPGSPPPRDAAKPEFKYWGADEDLSILRFDFDDS